MEIKKMFISAAIAAATLIPASAQAADEVIYEHGKVETDAEYTDLDGWGRELFTRCIFEADVQFTAPGSGITLRSQDNEKGGTSIRAVMRNDKLTLAADGGTSCIYYIDLDPALTYHISLIGSYGVSNGEIDMTVDTYGSDGSIADTKSYYMILMNNMYASSGVGPEHIRVEANTIADNIRVTELRPDGIRLIAPPTTVTPGSVTQLAARPQREGADLDYPMDISYSFTGEDAAISAEGALTIAADAPEGAVTVTASGGGMTDSAEIRVVSGEIFSITGAVMNEDETVIEGLRVVKNYFFDGTAAFVITVYDADGTLRDSFVKYIQAKAITAKTEAEIAIGYILPSGVDNDTIEIQAWSAAPASAAPAPEGETAVRAFFESNGGAVKWIEPHRVVVGMLNAKTWVMQIGNPVMFVDGNAITTKLVPYINSEGRTIAVIE